jgi:opacity protein-like surface antigen
MRIGLILSIISVIGIIGVADAAPKNKSAKSAPVNDWSFGVNASFNIATFTEKESGVLGDEPINVNMDVIKNNFGYGVSLGYRVDDKVKIDFNAGSLGKMSDTDDRAAMSLETYYFTMGLDYNLFSLFRSVDIFAGLELGAGVSVLEFDDIIDGDLFIDNNTKTKSVGFIGAARAGLEYALNDKISIRALYRLTRTNGADIDRKDRVSKDVYTLKIDGAWENSVVVGAKIKF